MNYKVLEVCLQRPGEVEHSSSISRLVVMEKMEEWLFVNVQGKNVHTEYRNSLGSIWLLVDFKSVIEIDSNSGYWLLRVEKTIGDSTSVEVGWIMM